MLYSPINLKKKIESELIELIQKKSGASFDVEPDKLLNAQKDQKTNLKLTIIQHRPSFASQKYISLKTKKAAEMGIETQLLDLELLDLELLGLAEYKNESALGESGKSEDGEPHMAKIRAVIKNLNSPYILQLPVDPSLMWITEQIPKELDLDLLNPDNFSALTNKNILPPTIRAIFWTISDFLNSGDDPNPKYESDDNQSSDNSVHNSAHNSKQDSTFSQNLEKGSKHISKSNILSAIPDLKGKTILIIGQGKLVGYPLAQCLLQTGATIISINEWTNKNNTENLKALCKQADIVISAIGKPKLIDKSMFQLGTFVIDAGTAESDGVLVGDIDKTDTENIILCPSPGGIGGMTILALFYNLILLDQLYGTSPISKL